MADSAATALKTGEAPAEAARDRGPRDAGDAELDAAGRAQALLGLQRASSGSTPPPDEAGGSAVATRRSAGGSHMGGRELVALQRLAGNGAVATLVPPSMSRRTPAAAGSGAASAAGSSAADATPAPPAASEPATPTPAPAADEQDRTQSADRPPERSPAGAGARVAALIGEWRKALEQGAVAAGEQAAPPVPEADAAGAPAAGPAGAPGAAGAAEAQGRPTAPSGATIRGDREAPASGPGQGATPAAGTSAHTPVTLVAPPSSGQGDDAVRRLDAAAADAVARPATPAAPPPRDTGVIEMEPMVITGTPPRDTGAAAPAQEPGTPAAPPPRDTGVIEMEPITITGTPPSRDTGVIEMEPITITGTPPSRDTGAATAAQAPGTPAAPPPRDTGVIEMEPMVITGTPPRDTGAAAPAQAPATPAAPPPRDTGVIEMEPITITGRPSSTRRGGPPARPPVPSSPVDGQRPRVDGGQIIFSADTIVASPPTAAPHAAPAPGSTSVVAPGALPRLPVAPTTQSEGLKPGFKEKRPSAPARPGGGRPGVAGPPRAGAPRRPAGGGGPPAVKPLSDPTLEKWKSASEAAIKANKPGDLGDAKDGPGKLEAKGKEIDATRKAGEIDLEADAKSKQPAMPAEAPKQPYLDTTAADAAVDAVKKAGERRLPDQQLSPYPAPPAYEKLTGADFVSRTDRLAIADLEKKLAGNLPPLERAQLSADLERRKKAVAEIEQRPTAATPGAAPPAVVDKGPASLEPLDPARADLLGDAIARLLGKVEPTAKDITDKAVAKLKGQMVPHLISDAEKEKETVRSELDKELRGIASAAGVTEEQLKTKIEEQKKAVAKEEADLKAKLEGKAVEATKQVADRTATQDKKVAGVKVAVDKEVAAKQAAVEGPPDTAAIERKRDEYVTRVEDVGAQAAAAARGALMKREADLDRSGNEQKGAIGKTANERAAAIRRHWFDDPDPNKGMAEARPTVQWGQTTSGGVDTDVKRLKAAAKTESEAIGKAVNERVTASKEAVRDWAARQQGRERSWWERLLDKVRDWGKQATKNNEAWEKQRNAESRDAMVKDFDVLTEVRKAADLQNEDAKRKALGQLDADQQGLAKAYLGGGITGIEFVARSTMNRITGRRMPEIATKLEQQAISTWESWEDLAQLARGSNPGFSPKVLAAKIRGGVAGWGTNEDQVYAGLGGARTAVERAALAKCYQKTYGVSMESDVRDDMSGHEMERAKALMEGRSAEADAAAIKEAVAGLGTDEDAIRNALRGKSKEELEAIKAEYLRIYHVELKTDLADDMGGAELDNAVALSEGQLDKADAAELKDAMSGPGTDEEKLKKVYERIRQEEEARARREGLTPDELKKRILERNAGVKSAYKAAGYGDLQADLKDELMDVDWKAAYGLKGGTGLANPIDDSDMKLMDALQEGDPSKISAAKAYQEHKGVYASDDAIEGVVRDQHKQADLDISLKLAADQARLKALADSGDLTPGEITAGQKDIEARKASKDADVKAKAQANMDRLRGEYSNLTGGTQTFDKLVLEETSGYSQLEIQDLVAAGGKLSDEKELYYATAGAGTDEDKIKEVLKGKTPAEIDKLRKAYADKHPGHTLDDDILSDLSGREDLDVGHTLKYGDPDTFAQQLEDAKGDPEKRKKLLADMKTMLEERKKFEETGAIGQIFAAGADPMNSAAQLEDAVNRAAVYDAALTRDFEANKGKDPKDVKPNPDLAAAKANFEMNYAGAVEAQEQVRKQIDAYTDVAAQVGAAIVGIAVTVATFGAAGPVVAAIYGAAAAAAATMAIKAQMKGAAYSWEEAGVDLAVGVVDAAVSGLTAGASKALTEALKRAAAAQVARQIAAQGGKKVSENVVKVWMKEAMKEAIENAIQAVPSAFVAGVLDDNTWKSDDPWGTLGKSSLQAAGMGAGIGVAAKGAIDVGGAAYKGIKGAKVEAGGAGAAPDVHAPPPEPKVDTPDPHSGKAAPPEPKPLDLPPEASPTAAADKAAAGDLPAGAKGADPTQSGKFPDAVGPEPKPGEPGGGRSGDPSHARGTPEPAGRATPADTAVPEPKVDLDDAVVTEFPEGSVGQLPDAQAKDPHANREFFKSWLESDPAREVALLRNDVTGEYVVVQGGTGGVKLGDQNPRWAEELLTPQQRASGKWQYEAHSHPIEAGGKHTPEYARWPSGGGDGDDFHGLVKEATASGKARSEEIHFVTERGTESLTYGYDPHAEKPYFIDRPLPDGRRERLEFSTIEDYHNHYEQQFGREPGRPVADDFAGIKEGIDQEAPTLRPGEIEPPTLRPGEAATPRAATEPVGAGRKSPAKPEATVAETGPQTELPRRPTTDDVGKPLTPDDLTQRYGMPKENVARIEGVCDDLGIIVDVRPTTPYAEPLLRSGEALPKPEKVKAKTINETDVEIGLAKKEDLGKVGFFDPDKIEPRRPSNYDELPPSKQEEIDDRIKQRKDEFADYRKDMQKLEEAGLIRIEPDGTVVNTGLVKGGELPFTGDHDIFDIRAKDGSQLTPEQYRAAVKAIRDADAGVMHGAVTGWAHDAPDTFNTPAGQKAYGKMVEAHSPGGKEPLVRLGDGDPKAVWYEPARPGAAAAPQARFVDTSIGTLDMNQVRSLTPASPDALTVTRGEHPKGPPNSVVRFDEHVTLVFDGEGNLFLKVTRAQIEDVRTGAKANTPHQLADALGIDRRIEGPVPHEVDNLAGPDPSYTVSGVISDATARGEAPNWQGKFTPGREVVIDGSPVRNYERAHTWGPGFGHESIYGIMLAPAEVNQAIQNRGIEKIIRDLHRSVTPGGRVEVEVVTRPHPHRPEYGDARFLATAEYTVRVVAPDGRTIEFKASFEVDPPPGGRISELEVRPRTGDEQSVANVLRHVAEEGDELRAARVLAGVESENPYERRRRGR